MSRTLSFLLMWGRVGIVFLLVVTAAAAYTPPAVLASSAGQTPSGPSVPIYLPLVLQSYEPPPPPSSYDLIDAALKQGQIDAETALEYKTYAEFDDGRLPVAYHASQVGGESGLFMNEVVAAYPTLSAQAKAILAPFFTPPYMANSWGAQSDRSLGPSAPTDWASISAAGGAAKVWYKKGDAEIQRKAGVVAAALTNDVWPKETALMGRTPIPDNAGIQNFVLFDHYRTGWNSTFVPFGGYAGMTVPQKCAPTASIIYINPALADTGSSTSIGLVETTAHEFMHALQFSYSLKVNPCTEYSWLGEASATWAEDYIYPSHNSEQRLAKTYLNQTDYEINDTFQWRDYGEYLLLYYYTHKYNDPQAVRRAWQNAQNMDSLMAFMSFGDMNYDQIAALWNKAPFDTFFKDKDGMDYQVKPTNQGDETLKATGGFKEYSLMDGLLPGSLRVYHYTVDPSVHTITFLNGLTTKITAGPYNGLVDDTVYNQDQVSAADSQGAEVVTLVKFEGQDQPWMEISPGRQDICQDWLKQRVSEILVFLTNQDMTQRDRYLDATGQQTKILVSSVPCVELTGTATKTNNYGGEVETESASGLVFQSYSYFPDLPPYVNMISPDIDMHLISGSVSWNISGTDPGGCTYSGSNSFSITEANNPSQLTLYFDLLPGSRRFLGYEGTGSPDDQSEVSYTMNCPNFPTQTFTETLGDFFMPDGTLPVNSDGSLSGSKTIDEGGEISTTFEWNFQPAPQ